jgi:predicted SAM-dependent methyltransferase
MRYLNVGCGTNIKEGFLNLDYNWRPGIDICWDIRKKLPLPDNFLQGIFAEHCLEHITYFECVAFLKEAYRTLLPGGTIRIVVPDGGLYIHLYQRSQIGEVVEFPYVEKEGLDDKVEDSLICFTPMMAINRIFRGYGHQFAYDYETLSAILTHAGFTDMQRVSFMVGRDEVLLIDSEVRRPQSLYVEATK